ncbi:MAG: hypothetical protein JKY65_09180, partial [Planctomycetes bacterium]|nr:hypothetical protein [Planctomycetota bacterium]
MNASPSQPDELEILVEHDLHGRRYALASQKDTPSVPLLFRREPEGYVRVTDQGEADEFADLMFLRQSLEQSAGPVIDFLLPGGETQQLHHAATVTLEGSEYLVLSESPLGPQILATRGSDGTLDPVQDPAVVSAVQAHWDEVQANAPQPDPPQPDPPQPDPPQPDPPQP